MRLDYALYSLAIILFAIAAVAFALANDEASNIIVVSAAIAGVLCVGGGYLLRPKASVDTTQTTATPSVPFSESAQSEKPVTTPIPRTDAYIAETPKTEFIKAESTKSQQFAEVTTPAVKTQSAAETPSSTQRITFPMQGSPEVALPAPPVQAAISATKAVPLPVQTEMKSELNQIRGIGGKRIEQLKTNGINTIQDLANASPTDLAARLDISPKIAKMWIGSAKKLAK